MLGFGSLIQWPPHYVGRGDSREEDGLSEQHSFWRHETEFSWQIMHCFCCVCRSFFFTLSLRSTIVNETFVLITSAVHVRIRCFIVFNLVCTTLRTMNDLYDIRKIVCSVLFTSKDTNV